MAIHRSSEVVNFKTLILFEIYFCGNSAFGTYNKFNFYSRDIVSPSDRQHRKIPPPWELNQVLTSSDLEITPIITSVRLSTDNINKLIMKSRGLVNFYKDMATMIMINTLTLSLSRTPSLYLELSLSRTNSLVPCEFEIERVNCILLFRIIKTN